MLRGGTLRRTGRAGAAPPVSESSDRGVTAIRTDDGRWVLINVSAAVAHQLEAETATVVPTELRDASERIVVLTDAQIEHVGGLLSMRRGAPIDLYVTPAVFEDLTATLPVLPVLQHYCGVHWRVIPVAGDRRVASFRVEGAPSLEFTAIATYAPAQPHTAHHRQPVVGDSIALAVRDLASGQRIFCAPGLVQLGAQEFDWMRRADCLLVDGHAPDGSHGEWTDVIAGLPARHKVLFSEHDDSERRRQLAARGIELAYDGLEIEL